jgi:hypothetical protein
MREVTKIVYYCEHCRRHGLSRAAMAKHEAGCTMNPVRVCRWRIDGHSDGTKQMDMAPIAQGVSYRAFHSGGFLSAEDIDWLRSELDGCPACMLAALRQSDVAEFHYDARSGTIFDYATEVERLRRDEREADARDQF